MALNLSTLTSPANSSVLEEVNTTADFLESCPVLRNLSRGSNKGGDAKQDVALNQPKALPLIDGDGYLYLSGVSGNGAVIGQSVLPATGDFDLRINFIYTLNTNSETDIFSQYEVDQTGRFFIAFDNNNKRVKIFWNGFGNIFSPNDSLVVGQRYVLKLTRSGSSVSLHLNDVLQVSHTIANSIPIHQVNSTVGFAYSRTSFHSLGAIFSVTEGSNVNIDFTATNVRHGDTKFKCATNQIVTINQSGNDPATIIKKPVLRFDGANDFMKGVFGQTIDGGYMFAAFSVLGNGGNPSGRVFSINSTGITDSGSRSAIFSHTEGTKTNLQSFYNGTPLNIQSNLFDESNGDILHESLIKNGSQKAGVNNANFLNTSLSTSIESEEFSISCNPTAVDARNTSIDLEYLALFDATITDVQADSVRNYINNRNNVFSLIDSQGFYFFDPQKTTFTGNFTAANTLDGYITGSDNGDTDVRSNLTLVQSTLNDQPSTDGYTITFNDSAEHLEFENSASQNLSGWQIVGTSLGTFVYRVQGAVTELNLLGNAGGAGYRQSGQSYGMILLPETATGADIEEARKLLIDRGASDGVSGTSLNQFWRGRTDILEFNSVNTAGVTDMSRAWQDAGLTKFALLDTSSVTNLSSAFANCNLASFPLIDCSSITQMGYAFYGNNFSDFPAIQAPVCNNFSGVWNSCSSLTSFSAGAKLGTSASNVNFTSAWQDSGLTSFPALDLSKGNNFSNTWKNCSNLTSFPAGAKLGTSASNVNFHSAFHSSGLTSFPALDLSTGTTFSYTWHATKLISFPAISFVKGQTFFACWFQTVGSTLIDFAAGCFDNWNPDLIQSNCFHFAWRSNNLSPQSVENIFVSLDASGQYATVDGAQGSNALSGKNIEIDYNTALGSFTTPATNAAVESLKTKGWIPIVNSVTL